jgi:hypothetical protein
MCHFEDKQCTAHAVFMTMLSFVIFVNCVIQFYFTIYNIFFTQANIPNEPSTVFAAASDRLNVLVGQEVKIDEIGVDGKFVLKAVGDGSDFNKKVKNAILGIEDKPVKGK